MAKPDLQVHRAFILAQLKSDKTAALVSAAADKVAQTAAASVGSVNGHPTPVVTTVSGMREPNMRRLDTSTKYRRRSVVFGQHPTPNGRQKAREALQAAIAASGLKVGRESSKGGLVKYTTRSGKTRMATAAQAAAWTASRKG